MNTEEPTLPTPHPPGNHRPDLFGALRRYLASPAGWLAIIMLYAIYSRVWGLADKVMHHDESLFAYYGYWLYRGNGYDYQPILHGPILQFVSAFFFFLFGDDQWTMRIPSLLGGLLMFPVAWNWRRYIGGAAGAVAVSGLIALSPSLAYYTRFLRNDVPYLTVTMWCAYCLMRTMQTGRPKYVWGAMMGAILMFSMMESSIFFFAACLGYLGTMCLVDILVWRRGDERLPPAKPGELSPIHVIAAGGVALLVTLISGWLFHRVLYSTLHIYKPVVAVAKKIGLTLPPDAANLILALGFLLVTWVLAVIVYANWRRPAGRYGLLGKFARVVWLNRWHVVASFAVSLIIYEAAFTTFFTYEVGDGWLKSKAFDQQLRDFRGEVRALTPVQIYQNTWEYWWDQHKEHRIKGPFHYYIPLLLLYELPTLVLVLLGWARALRRAARPWFHVALLAAMHVLLALGLWVLSVTKHPIDWELMDKKLHLSHPTHLFLILLYMQILTYIAPMLYRQGRKAESFITYWGVTSLFAYSYAGEKVPWLVVHTVGPFTLLAAAELVRLWRRFGWGAQASPALSVEPLRRPRAAAPVFGALALCAVLYQAHNNHLLLQVHPWSPAERLVYNHTSPDIAKAVQIVDDLADRTSFGNKLPLLIQGEMAWPLHWYLRHYDNLMAPVGETAENTSRPLVMVDWMMAGVPNLRQNYTIRRMKVREWWEPKMLDLSSMADLYLAFTPEESYQRGPMAERYAASLIEWRKLWHYLAYREIWIDPENPGWSNGTNEFALCIRKDIDQRLMNYDWLGAVPKRTDVPVFQPY